MHDKNSNLAFLILILVLVLDGGFWFQVFWDRPSQNPGIQFLDVGQGDATLIRFGDEVKILVDAGPDSKVLRALRETGLGRKYIDLGIVSHPQLDHFNGFNYLLERYDFGAFILNGREASSPEWSEFLQKIENKKIPVFVLASEDVIKFQSNRIDFLSPDRRAIQSAEVNDTSFVNLVTTPSFKLLLTGDIGFNVEKYLVEKFGSGLQADILKIPHHGSKYSSSEQFLEKVNPRVAVIEVGDNRYGHPTAETLLRLSDLGIQVFRTDEGEGIEVKSINNKLLFF